jgi:hypothetical protein
MVSDRNSEFEGQGSTSSCSLESSREASPLRAERGKKGALALSVPPKGKYITDILCGSFSQPNREFSQDEEVVHRIAIFFVEVTPGETLALARLCRVEKKNGGDVLCFRQPGGQESAVALIKG